MKETAFKAPLIEKLRANGCEAEAVESHATCPGMPDVWWHYREAKISGWIETKIIQPNGRIEFEPKQLPLLERWWLAGVNVCVLAHDPRNRATFMIKGDLVRAAGKNLPLLIELGDILEVGTFTGAALVRELIAIDLLYRERIKEVR